jgi:hypothetical protein
MENFNKIFNLDSEMIRKLELLKAAAASSEKDISHFLELDCCPVLGLYLITDDKLNDGTNDRDIAMRFINQPDYHPKVLTDKSEAIKLAYNKYVEKTSFFCS